MKSKHNNIKSNQSTKKGIKRKYKYIIIIMWDTWRDPKSLVSMLRLRIEGE